MIFPLPLDFFPPLKLSEEEQASFLQWGDSLLQQTLDAYHREQFDTPEVRERKWKPLKTRHELTVYRRRKLSGDPNQFRYLCTGRIPGTLDEVVMGRYADNTVDFRRISGVYREDIVDCAVLGVVKKKSPEDPFFFSGFKWMTVKSPGKGLVKNRDVCWYEQVGVTKDRNGKEVGYTLTESVELPTCPTFSECVRAKFSICYLYKRNKSGGVKVYMRGNNDAGGNVAEWVADMKSAELWLRIEQAMPVAHAVIATALVQAGKHTVRPFITTGKCEVCHAKASGLMSSSKKCAVCHRLTCSNCVLKVRVLSFHDFRVPQKELFCKKCLRLIHQVNLRDPRTVQNLAEYAANSINGPEGSNRSFLDGERAGGSSHYTDDSTEADDDEARLKPAVSVTSSDSGHGSYQRMPQPKIGGGGSSGRTQQAASKPNARAANGAAPPRRQQQQQQSPYTHVQPGSQSMPANPVVIYDEPSAAKTSRSMDEYKRNGARRAGSGRMRAPPPPPPPPMDLPTPPYGDQVPAFSQTVLYDTRDSETPMTESRIVTSAAKFAALDTVAPGLETRKHHAFSGVSSGGGDYEFASPVGHMDAASTDSLMAQIIRMNMIAEKSRQQIRDNLKIAQQLHMH